MTCGRDCAGVRPPPGQNPTHNGWIRRSNGGLSPQGGDSGGARHAPSAQPFGPVSGLREAQSWTVFHEGQVIVRPGTAAVNVGGVIVAPSFPGVEAIWFWRHRSLGDGADFLPPLAEGLVNLGTEVGLAVAEHVDGAKLVIGVGVEALADGCQAWEVSVTSNSRRASPVFKSMSPGRRACRSSWPQETAAVTKSFWPGVLTPSAGAWTAVVPRRRSSARRMVFGVGNREGPV
jgi:hypothetical protein